MRHFPLFLNLGGRDVLVVGGGVVALRKVEALRRAEARITVIAPEVHEELHGLAARGDIRLLERRFTAEGSEASGLDAPDLARPWLIIAATDDRPTNAAVAEAAERAHIICNVVDERELSTCLMPAVIDRSPVQIAVSTGGTSPVLARLIRERLEALLDESLGPLADFAGRWRDAAHAALDSLAARRRYFSWLLSGPAAAAIRARDSTEADRLATQELARRSRLAHDGAVGGAEQVATGHVTLVGAGPGDPGLLTLKGLRALQEADIVIHDRLASSAVLALARRDAQRVDVGKRAGGAGTPQTAINTLLVEHARCGQRVVRLKGGDPFIFGRGGEEVDALRAAGLSYEVIPGITAAVAASACAGIPLTDRRHVHGVRLLTGNEASLLDDFDFSDAAASRETLAVYMGVAQLAALRERLLSAGVSPVLPAAIISNASHAEQRVVLTTVADLVHTASTHAIQTPAITIIGSVAALARSKLAVWPKTGQLPGHS